MRHNGGRSVNMTELGGIGKALGSEFLLERVRVNGGKKVYVVKPRNVAPNGSGVNGGRTGRREERRGRRKARQGVLRATNPHLTSVKS